MLTMSRNGFSAQAVSRTLAWVVLAAFCALPAAAGQVSRVSLCGTNNNGGSTDADLTCENPVGGHPTGQEVGADLRLENTAQAYTGSASLGSTDPDFGAAMATGFLDGDGLVDLVVGAPGASRIFIYYGKVDYGVGQDPLALREPALNSGGLADGSFADAVIVGPPNS